MMLEASLGGELRGRIRSLVQLDVPTTMFYAGIVVQTLEYLHRLAIVHRDITPENFTVDSNGYLKLVDFGFAK